MAINLSKGQAINLNKDEHDLSSITIGLGWKIQQQKAGLLGGLFGGKQEDFDLDAIAFLMDQNDQVTALGDDRLVGSDVVFFNSLKHPTGHVYHSGDNRVGGDGAQDDEQIVVKLTSLDNRYQKILFLVCIYQGQQKQQHFGKVQSAYIRAVDAKGKRDCALCVKRRPFVCRTLHHGFWGSVSQGWRLEIPRLGRRPPIRHFCRIA